MRRELVLIETDPELESKPNDHTELLAKTRVASTNAMLMSTVYFGLVAEQVRIVTRHFANANRLFLAVEILLHDSLNQQIDRIETNLIKRTREFGVILSFASVVALAATIF